MNQVLLLKPIVGIVALLLLTNCTKKQEPEKESKIGLEQAMKGVEQAEEGFKGMREKGETLQQKIDEQTKFLDATIAKHTSILTNRVAAEEKLIAGLPAAKQSVLLPLLADLKQQVSGVEVVFREYRQAPSAKVEESKDKLQKALEKLNSAFAQFDAKVSDEEVK
jgi:predicted  nucleic acid-binding Zn-ribbon protein